MPVAALAFSFYPNPPRLSSPWPATRRLADLAAARAARDLAAAEAAKAQGDRDRYLALRRRAQRHQAILVALESVLGGDK